MITIETTNPVRYSDLTGDKKAARKDKRQKNIGKVKDVYQKGKDTGTLAAIENIFLKGGSGAQESPTAPIDNFSPPAPTVKGWKALPTWQKGLIITSILAVVGGGVYYYVKHQK